MKAGGRAASRHALLAVVLVGFNLRIAVVTVGPLIGRIRVDTGMSNAVAGLLTTIPFLCMGLFAWAGAGLIRRLGFSKLIALSLSLIALGTLVRAGMPTPALLVVATIPIGLGISLAGVALPSIVKEQFPQRSGAVTGAYVASFSLGGAIGALTIVPAADALGGWREALAITAVPTAAVLAAWLWIAAPFTDVPRTIVRRSSRRPSRAAVVLGLIFGCQGMCFSGLITWIAAIYTDAGWAPSAAALATASVPLITIPVALILPALSDRGDRRLWVAASALTLAIGLVGLAIAPAAAAWLWLALCGTGLGAIFPLALALPLDLADDPLQIADLSAWMQGIGFSMAAAAPFLIGALRDASGGFGLAIAAMAALATIAAVLALAALAPTQAHARP